MGTETVTTEVTEFEDGSRIVETKTVESEYIEGDTPPISEVVEEVAAVEEVTDAAVEIAAIEAERDIVIAEIRAEVETAAVEAMREGQEETTWQQNIEAKLETLAGQVETLATLLTPQPSSASEANLSETDPGPGNVDPMPVSPEAEAPESLPEQPKPRPKSRWI